MSWAVAFDSPLIGAKDKDGKETDLLIRVVEGRPEFSRPPDQETSQLGRLRGALGETLEKGYDAIVFWATGEEIQISDDLTDDEKKFVRIMTQAFEVEIVKDLIDSVKADFNDMYPEPEDSDGSEEQSRGVPDLDGLLKDWDSFSGNTQKLFFGHLKSMKKAAQRGDWLEISESNSARRELLSIIEDSVEKILFIRLVKQAAEDEESTEENVRDVYEVFDENIEQAYKDAKRNSENQGEPSPRSEQDSKKTRTTSEE